jgi:hypothetical protein
MNALDTILSRARLVLAAVAVLALLVLPATASAKRHGGSKDRNHDGIADKWAKRYHLGKGAGMAKADPDKDGLTNRGEFKSGTNPRKADSDGDGVGDANEDPDRDNVDNGNEAREHTNPQRADSNGNGVKDGREDADRDKLNNAGEDDASTDPINPDTDGDGIKDGQERAGEIVSFDGTTLTLRVFGGATLSGTVDANTYIDCGDNSAGDPNGDQTPADDGWVDEPVDEKVRARRGLDLTVDDSTDPGVDDGSADDGFVDDGTTDDGSADDGTTDDGTTDDSSDDSTDDSGDFVDDGAGGCATDTLKPGAVVAEADVSYTGKGAFFDAIELAR